MEFKHWLEATVEFASINEAIKKTLEFVVTKGVWKFKPKPYGMAGIKPTTVAGHFYCDKGHHFLITANTVLPEDPLEPNIDTYDSVTGNVDAHTKIQIIGVVAIINDDIPAGTGRLKKVAERSNTGDGRLHSPYELAQWVKKVIDDYHSGGDGGDGDEDDVTAPTPQGSSLIGV